MNVDLTRPNLGTNKKEREEEGGSPYIEQGHECPL